MSEPVGDCLTCGEVDGVEGECPTSKRPCGHHCNHTWTHDVCHWCGWEVPDDDTADPTPDPETTDG